MTLKIYLLGLLQIIFIIIIIIITINNNNSVIDTIIVFMYLVIFKNFLLLSWMSDHRSGPYIKQLQIFSCSFILLNVF